MMTELDRVYPAYGFALHKGYGVPEHLQALETYGPCPVHRLTYKPVLPREARG
jgi:ribonuclease HII